MQQSNLRPTAEQAVTAARSTHHIPSAANLVFALKNLVFRRFHLVISDHLNRAGTQIGVDEARATSHALNPSHPGPPPKRKDPTVKYTLDDRDDIVLYEPTKSKPYWRIAYQDTRGARQFKGGEKTAEEAEMVARALADELDSAPHIKYRNAPLHSWATGGWTPSGQTNWVTKHD